MPPANDDVSGAAVFAPPAPSALPPSPFDVAPAGPPGGPEWGAGAQPGAPVYGPADPGAPVYGPADPGAPALYPAHPYAYPYGYVAPPAPPKRRGVAVVALCVGIGALLLSWFPVVGAFAGLTAVVLGIVALALRQRKALAVPGLVLGAVAIVVGVVIALTAWLTATFASLGDLYATTSGDSSWVGVEDPGDVIDPTDYVRLDAAATADVVAHPTAHYGEQVLLFGTLEQFNDEGGCSLYLLVDGAQHASAAYEVWALTYSALTPESASCEAGVDYLYVGDHVRVYATVRGLTTVEFEDGPADTLTIDADRIDKLPSLR